MPRRRHGTRAGCIAALVLAVLLVALFGYAAAHAYAQPDLGAPPQGPADGDTQLTIGTRLALELGVELVRSPHAHVFLSEQDLTVLARLHNPDPADFPNPEVRVRDALLEVDARTGFWPGDVTVVGWLTVAVDVSTGTPHATTQLQRLDLGTLSIPSWARGLVDSRLVNAVNIDQVFQGKPELVALGRTIECVAITSSGLEIGVHRPDASPDPSSCPAG